MYNNGWKAILGTVLAFFVVLTFIASIRIVDASKSCAVVQLGNVTGRARTGFQFVTPYITSLACYPQQVHVYQTAQESKGDADYVDFPVEIKTGDGQTAEIEFNLVYFVPPENVQKIRQQVASSENDLVMRIIANYSRSVPRDLGPKYTASQLYGIGRVDYEREIENDLRIIFTRYGVVLDKFALRDVNFDPEYEATIEAQQIAREQIETEGYKAEAAVNTARQTAALAKGEADAEIARATGHAEAIRIQASADAESIAIRGDAIRQYPQVLNLEFFKTLSTSEWMMVPWDRFEPYMQIPEPAQ